jgi:hypothetical protein
MNKMSELYAYLKPNKTHSDYFVHVTIDHERHVFRLYYHMSWWKGENIPQAKFQTWMDGFEKLVLTSNGKRTSVKKRNHSVKNRGKTMLSYHILKDVFGFVEKDTSRSLPVQLSCYVNDSAKIIEIECFFKYKTLGSFPTEICKLPIFTNNPDTETVKANIPFFTLDYVDDTVQSINQNALEEEPLSTSAQPDLFVRDTESDPLK